jgi:hypothetical protein
MGGGGAVATANRRAKTGAPSHANIIAYQSSVVKKNLRGIVS